jgi:putative transposase
MPGRSARRLPAGRATLVAWLAAPPYLGAPPGSSAALPPWSQTLVRPPHLPGLVTGGGLTPEGQGRAGRPGFVVPARGVMAVLRGKRRAALRQALAREALTVPAPRRPPPRLT